MSSAYDIISSELPKWWESLKANKDDVTLPDAAELIIPQTPADIALMGAGGPIGGKLVKGALGAFAASSYAPEADAGVLPTKVGALGRIMKLLASKHPFGAVNPLPVGRTFNGMTMYDHPTGKISVVHNMTDRIPEEYLKLHPGAEGNILDMSNLSGGGEDFYRSWFHSLPKRNVIQVDDGTSAVNGVRKSINMARAASEGADLSYVVPSKNQNIHTLQDAPFTKAFLPKDTPDKIDAATFAMLDPDERAGWNYLQQMSAGENAIKTWLPESYHSNLLEPGLLPRDTGQLLHQNINEALTNRMNTINEMRPNNSQRTLRGMRIEEPSTALGTRSLDETKLLLEALTTPENLHPDILNDYLGRLYP